MQKLIMHQSMNTENIKYILSMKSITVWKISLVKVNPHSNHSCLHLANIAQCGILDKVPIKWYTGTFEPQLAQ